VKPLIAIGGLLILLALIALVTLRDAEGPLAGFDEFPHAMLPAEVVTSDPAELRIWTGAPQAPLSVEIEGVTCYPAYFHPDPTVVSQRDGRPLLFPLIRRVGEDGETVATTPPLPPSGRPLGVRRLDEIVRYHVEEGRVMLDTFRERMKKD